MALVNEALKAWALAEKVALLRCSRDGVVSAGQQRCNTPHGYAAISPFRTFGWNFQILLAIALGRQILCRYRELLTEHQRYRFCAPV